MGDTISKLNVCQDDTTVRSTRDTDNGGKHQNPLFHKLFIKYSINSNSTQNLMLHENYLTILSFLFYLILFIFMKLKPNNIQTE
jgi:hypothetical protein